MKDALKSQKNGNGPKSIQSEQQRDNMMMVRNSMPNGMHQSAGGNARFRSIPKSISKFELIERSIDEASKIRISNKHCREEASAHAERRDGQQGK
jgi:hypothetical protein